MSDNPFQKNPQVMCAVACCCFILIFIIIILADSGHKIEEGFIGIYYQNGALQDGYTRPGIHFKSPFVTTVTQISTRKVTDTVENAPCVTRDGITNTFSSIQIINQVNVEKIIPTVKEYGKGFKKDLILDRVKEMVVLFCANNSIDEVYNTKFLDATDYIWQGVERGIMQLSPESISIEKVVVPKPNIPADIAENYKQVKVKWTEQLVATQNQELQKIQKETEEMVQIADAQRKQNVTLIETNTELQKKVADATKAAQVLDLQVQMDMTERLGALNVTEINAEILRIEREAAADLHRYEIEAQAKANERLYTPAYVQLEIAKSMAGNTKFFFSGDDSVVGTMLSAFFGGSFENTDYPTPGPTTSPTAGPSSQPSQHPSMDPTVANETAATGEADSGN